MNVLDTSVNLWRYGISSSAGGSAYVELMWEDGTHFPTIEIALPNVGDGVVPLKNWLFNNAGVPAMNTLATAMTAAGAKLSNNEGIMSRVGSIRFTYSDAAAIRQSSFHQQSPDEGEYSDTFYAYPTSPDFAVVPGLILGMRPKDWEHVSGSTAMISGGQIGAGSMTVVGTVYQPFDVGSIALETSGVAVVDIGICRGFSYGESVVADNAYMTAVRSLTASDTVAVFSGLQRGYYTIKAMTSGAVRTFNAYVTT